MNNLVKILCVTLALCAVGCRSDDGPDAAEATAGAEAASADAEAAAAAAEGEEAPMGEKIGPVGPLPK